MLKDTEAVERGDLSSRRETDRICLRDKRWRPYERDSAQLASRRERNRTPETRHRFHLVPRYTGRRDINAACILSRVRAAMRPST